jgi:uncharacterized repeat protein (TIGR01451 family)
VITDLLDSAVDFVDASHGGSPSSEVVTWNVAGIAIGETITRTLWVNVRDDVASGTTLSNTAWVTSTQGVGDDATTTTQVTTAADLQIAKIDTADPVLAGALFTYSITVTNNGPSAASGATVADALPGELTFNAAGSSPECTASGQDVTCDIEDLSAGAEVTLTIAVRTDPALEDGTTLMNTASVSGNESDPNAGNNSAQQWTTVNREADLRITKSASADPVSAGTSFTYAIGVTNNGPSVASNVTVADTLPVGLTFNAAGSSPECWGSGQDVTCAIGGMSAGEEVTLTIAVSADASLEDGTTLTNTASVWGNENDPNEGNNWVQEWTTVNRGADLQISKNASADPVSAGASFTYAVGVINNGPSVATGIVVSDALPLELTFDAAGSSPECSAVGQDVTCTLDSLPVSGAVTLVVAVTVDSGLQEELVLSNTASVSCNESDSNDTNNSATEDILVKKNQVFLPILLKQGLTELDVFNDNTGDDVTFVVLGTPVSCVVPNNTTQFCGTFLPGTYQIRVNSACGEALFTKTYGPGPVTTRVFCK